MAAAERAAAISAALRWWGVRGSDKMSYFWMNGKTLDSEQGISNARRVSCGAPSRRDFATVFLACRGWTDHIFGYCPATFSAP
jgi:hypothetical protein